MLKIIIKISLLFALMSTQINSAWSANKAAVKDAWVNLDRTVNQCDDLFDYYPEGGMRIFYCHIKSYINYRDLVNASHIPVFRKGPHSRDKLNLHSRYEFGYYNRDFVLWLKDYAIIAASDPGFRASTQAVYDKYVKPLALTYHKTYLALQSDPQYLQTETNKYLEQMNKKTLGEYYAEDFYEFKDLYKTGYDGNVVKTAVLFWFRRHIDGTDDAFFEALDTLVNVYKS